MSQKNPIINFYNKFKKEFFLGNQQVRKWENLIKSSDEENVIEALKNEEIRETLMMTAKTSSDGSFRQKVFRINSKLNHEQALKEI